MGPGQFADSCGSLFQPGKQRATRVMGQRMENAVEALFDDVWLHLAFNQIVDSCQWPN